MQIELKRRLMPEAVLKLVDSYEKGEIANIDVFLVMLKGMAESYKQFDRERQSDDLKRLQDACNVGRRGGYIASTK